MPLSLKTLCMTRDELGLPHLTGSGNTTSLSEPEVISDTHRVKIPSNSFLSGNG